jgi:hypothetical protein
MVLVDGPPDPMTMPVRSLVMSFSPSPASTIAWSMATWFQAAPCDRKRMARRSISAAGSSVGAPQTWQRKPCSAKESEKLMPDLASCSEACTSLALLPIDDTMPRPETTTRLIRNSFQRVNPKPAGPKPAGQGCAN